MKNYLEIGKIVRAHGIKGAVKVISYLDNYNFSHLKQVYIGVNKTPAEVIKASSLNNNAFSLLFDICPTVEATNAYINMPVYIDRNDYHLFENKIYLSDLINKPLISTEGEELGLMIDFDDYGASVVLTIKCGTTSYQIPFVEDIVKYDANKDAFVIDKQTFMDMRV